MSKPKKGFESNSRIRVVRDPGYGIHSASARNVALLVDFSGVVARLRGDQFRQQGSSFPIHSRVVVGEYSMHGIDGEIRLSATRT